MIFGFSLCTVSVRDNSYLLRVSTNIVQKMEIRAILSNCKLDRD